jgi:cytochrome c biogenesis protein CcdA
MGTGNDDEAGRGLPQHLQRALVVGGTVTAGFIVLFGVAGTLIGLGASAVAGILPYLGLAIGVLLTLVGAWLLGGGKLYSAVAQRAAAHMGDPGQTNVRGYFLFGLSYGTASLSCTLPIFLAVVGTSFAVSSIGTSVGQFVLYGAGMGTVMMGLTLGMAVFKGTMVGGLRKALPYLQPVGTWMMILAGSYIVFYWLTIGDLL